MEDLPILNQPLKKPRRRWKANDGLVVAVVAWFIAAWFIGSSRTDADIDSFFTRAWPETASIETISDGVYRAVDDDGTVLGYATIGSAAGYGGPLSVIVAVTPDGICESLAIVEHRETPAFFEQITRGRFLQQLAGKSYADPTILGDDIDGISGATYSSRALTQSVHRAVRSVAVEQLELAIPQDAQTIVFGFPELILLLLFIVTVGVRRFKVSKRTRAAVRWTTLLTGMIFLGFVFNGSFVLAHINMVLLGYWPEWQTHLYWYILIIGILLFKARKDWNVYCYDFCPFGAVQEFLGLIGGAKPRPVRWSNVLLWGQRILVVLAVSLALIYRNPGFSSFEIFGTMFDLNGSNFQFAILAAMLLASLFLYRPWCRYLCPLHKYGIEGLFESIRRILKNVWLKLLPGDRQNPDVTNSQTA